jgi:hypothetical protein
MGGANRKGFNGGFSKIDTGTVSISVSIFDFCLRLHDKD